MKQLVSWYVIGHSHHRGLFCVMTAVFYSPVSQANLSLPPPPSSHRSSNTSSARSSPSLRSDLFRFVVTRPSGWIPGLSRLKGPLCISLFAAGLLRPQPAAAPGPLRFTHRYWIQWTWAWIWPAPPPDAPALPAAPRAAESQRSHSCTEKNVFPENSCEKFWCVETDEGG